MNKFTLFLLATLAFATAGAYTFIHKKLVASPASIALQLQEKKASRAGCSAVYIPSVADPIPALTGWGNYQWKITTSSDSAQFYFDQGINMYYSFHIIEARASFDKATRFDSACAMAWWGKALAFGPNINDFGYTRPSEAYSSSVRAKELHARCTPEEKALIDAMAIRYTADTAQDQATLNKLYTETMKTVYERYPAHADISALYADALMLLHPWDLYDHESKPKPWTGEIVRVLEHGLKLNEGHPGANHYYIHAVEASLNPEKALKSADTLSHSMPEISHITHMPSHIYIRTGNYDKGIQVNNRAIAGYLKHLNYFPSVGENLPLYSLHNSHMIVNCAQMAGNYAQSLEAAKQLQRDIPAGYIQFGGAVGNYIQYLDQSAMFAYLRFGKWQEILAVSVEDSLAFTPVIQYFARGIAHARTGELPAARKDLLLMQEAMTKSVLKEPLTPFNSAFDASLVAEKILEGVIEEEEGDKEAAIVTMREAVKAEDKLIYNEPRDWGLPARHYLGNVLLKSRKYKEAETVFLKDLVINPNNGWSLTGLSLAQQGQGLAAASSKTNARLSKAWALKDVKIEGPVF